MKKKSFFIIYITIITVVLLEISGRVYLKYILKKSSQSKFQFDSYRVYSHRPGFREGDGKRDWIVINSQGFRRNSDVSEKKPENTFRVFLMGGSAAHGISTSPPYPEFHIYSDETIDAYLEKMFREKYNEYNFEIINCAVTGYHVFQHTQYILSELLDYDPDAVIFFDGANDHFLYKPDYNYYNDYIYQFWKPRLQKPSFINIADYFSLWLSRYSGFARGYLAWREQQDAKNGWKKLIAPAGYTNEEIINNHKQIAGKQFLRAIEHNILILKNHNIPSLICLQPMLVLRNKDYLSSEEISWLHTDTACKILYPVVKEELQKVCDKHTVSLIDINQAFNAHQNKSMQLFIDYCHLAPLGGEVSAREIFPKIDSLFINKKNMLLQND